MPHSSGGGSHGGGSHGGSHGSSSNHISTHYFPGSKRFLRHNRVTGADEYIYSERMPQKTGLSSIIIGIVTAVIFLGAFGFSNIKEFPRKLPAHYMDVPEVHDDINVIHAKDQLEDILKQYQEKTGICTHIYTAYHEEWINTYSDPADYCMNVYTGNFQDEEHFVIIFSIPFKDAECYDNSNSDKHYVPDFVWEAVQGDDTDPILTEEMFTTFRKMLQKDLEDYVNPGDAFTHAFQFAMKDADSKLGGGALTLFGLILKTFFPLILVLGFFALFLFVMIKQYIKDKNIEYTQVPLDEEDRSSQSGPADQIASATGTEKPTKALKVLYAVIMIPFLLVGFGMIMAGITSVNHSNGETGIFFILFGAAWTIILFSTIVKTFFMKEKTKDTDPITAGYPKTESPKTVYPKSEYPDDKPADTPEVKSPFVPLPSSQKPEFDPVFFNDSKSDIEDDDEDYKRMKRQGFE